MEGTDDIFQIIPAPGAVLEEGTPINMATLLKRTTGALLGLDEAAVPDDALVAVKGLLDARKAETDALYALNPLIVETGGFTGTGAGLTSKTITFQHYPKIVFLEQFGIMGTTNQRTIGLFLCLYGASFAAYFGGVNINGGYFAQTMSGHTLTISETSYLDYGEWRYAAICTKEP